MHIDFYLLRLLGDPLIFIWNRPILDIVIYSQCSYVKESLHITAPVIATAKEAEMKLNGIRLVTDGYVYALH